MSGHDGASTDLSLSLIRTDGDTQALKAHGEQGPEGSEPQEEPDCIGRAERIMDDALREIDALGVVAWRRFGPQCARLNGFAHELEYERGEG